MVAAVTEPALAYPFTADNIRWLLEERRKLRVRVREVLNQDESLNNQQWMNILHLTLVLDREYSSRYAIDAEHKEQAMTAFYDVLARDIETYGLQASLEWLTEVVIDSLVVIINNRQALLEENDRLRDKLPEAELWKERYDAWLAAAPKIG